MKLNYNQKDYINFTMHSSAIPAYFLAVRAYVRDVGSFAKFVNTISCTQVSNCKEMRAQ